MILEDKVLTRHFVLKFVGNLCLLHFRRTDVVPAQSSDSGTSVEPKRVVTFVELLKRRSEPLGLVLKGTCGWCDVCACVWCVCCVLYFVGIVHCVLRVWFIVYGGCGSLYIVCVVCGMSCWGVHVM